MKKVLHVSPESCSEQSKLLRKRKLKNGVWSHMTWRMEDTHRNCKALVQKGTVHVADIKFPLPYRAMSFFLMLVSDALDYLSPKYFYKNIPELVRVSVDGIVIFTGTSFFIDEYWVHSFKSSILYFKRIYMVPF